MMLKKMRFNWFFALLIGSFIASPPGANAWEIDFQPRLEGGVAYYAFESEVVHGVILPYPSNYNTGGSVTQGSFEFSDYLPFIAYGGTVFLDRFYLDFNGQKSATSKDSTQTVYSSYFFIDGDVPNNYINTGFLLAEGPNDARFDRNEMAVSLGYAVSKRFNVYAGYKQASTEFKVNYDYTTAYRFYEYDGGLFTHGAGKSWGNIGFSFEYEGPFVGGLYGWEIDSKGIFNGVLTASVALAHLNGKVKLDYRDAYQKVTQIDGETVDVDSQPVEGGSFTLRFDTKGQALGATISLAWYGMTGIDGLSYYVGVNGYRYEFDAENNGQSDINETAVSYRGGLSYIF